MGYAGSTTYLRVQKQANNYTGWWSADGNIWTLSGTLTSAATVSAFGVFTISQNWSGSTPVSVADFDYFHVNFTFAAWRDSRFSPTDMATGLTGMSADFDSDGMVNLLEYAFGNNPKVTDRPDITSIVSADKLRISFPCDATRTDITYTVQASSTLASDSWTDIARSIGGATVLPVGSLSTVADSGSGARSATVIDSATTAADGGRFLRVRVTSQ